MSLSYLKDQASTIHPSIEYFQKLYQEKEIKPYDLVGIFILSWLSIRRQSSWSNGRLKESFSQSQFDSIPILYVSAKVESIKIPYLCKKLKCKEKDLNHLSLIDIFNTLQLSGIKHNNDNYINRCMVMWALEKP